MPVLLTRPSSLLIGLGLCLLLWGASIAGVYWDLQRRRRPRAELIVWLALVALLPGVGLLAYLLAWALNRFFPLPGASAGAGARRFTLLRPPPAAAPRTGTIMAADLVKETLFERRPAPAASPLPAAEPPIVQPVFQPPPPAGLVVAAVSGPHAGDEFVVASLPARIGRGPGLGLRLDRDRGVSREHAELYWQAGAVHLRDLHSQHGTSVNGRRVEDQALQPGDRIELGLSALVVKQVGA